MFEWKNSPKMKGNSYWRHPIFHFNHGRKGLLAQPPAGQLDIWLDLLDLRNAGWFCAKEFHFAGGRSRGIGLGSDLGGLEFPGLQKCGELFWVKCFWVKLQDLLLRFFTENAPTEAVMFEAPKRIPDRSLRWLRSLIPSWTSPWWTEAWQKWVGLYPWLCQAKCGYETWEIEILVVWEIKGQSELADACIWWKKSKTEAPPGRELKKKMSLRCKHPATHGGGSVMLWGVCSA